MLQTFTDGTVDATVAVTADVSVTCGVNRHLFNLSGKSIRDIRALLQQALNLPQESMVLVNGQVAAEDQVAQPGDEVEFLKEAGVKGVIA
jgi:hypothetical protein